MNEYFKITSVFVLVLQFSFSLSAQTASAAEFTLSVNRTVVEEGKSLQLTFKYTGETTGENPDFSALTNNFDVLSSYPSSQRYNINGKASVVNQWVFQVIAKRKGSVIIPPITYKGLSTNPERIEVKASGSLGVSQDIFLETIVDKSAAYVGEQIKLIYRLYFDTNIDNQLDVEELSINDAEISQAPVQQFERRVDGRLYQVAEFTYLIRAERDGTLVVPRLNWGIRVNTGRARSLFDNFGRYEVVRKRSQEKVIRIKAIPSSYPTNQPWLPAADVTLEATWSNDVNQMSVGEPNTRTVIVSAVGLPAKSLPLLNNDFSNNDIRLYSEPAELKESFENGNFVGRMSQSSAIIVNNINAVSLPAIKLAWWNTATDSLEYAELSAQTLKVSNSSGSAPSAPAQALQTEPPQAIESQPVGLGDDNSASKAQAPVVENQAPAKGVYTNIWLQASMILNVLTFLLLAWLYVKYKRSLHRSSNDSRLSRAGKTPGATVLLDKITEAQKAKDWAQSYFLISRYAKEVLKLDRYSDLVEAAVGRPNLVNGLTALEQSLYSVTHDRLESLCEFGSELKLLQRDRTIAVTNNDLPELYAY